MKKTDHIITAKDYCRRDGVDGVRERILKIRNDKMMKRRVPIAIQIDKTSTRPVHARIELGQWIADCECGGCEFVDADEPIFFCFGCANSEDANRLRNVIFPPADMRMEIERLLLERPVNNARGLDDMERAGMAKALIFIKLDGVPSPMPLTRSWNPDETLDDLHAQQDDAIEAWHKDKDRSVE